MKIIFENKNSNWDVESNMSIKILDNKAVKIQICNFSEDIKDPLYVLDKSQLSEFIGALLHIQSKLNNRK